MKITDIQTRDVLKLGNKYYRVSWVQRNNGKIVVDISRDGQNIVESDVEVEFNQNMVLFFRKEKKSGKVSRGGYARNQVSVNGTVRTYHNTRKGG